MDAFTRLTGIAAPLRMRNVDTDMIVPKQFMKTVERTGLAAGLFYNLAVAPDGSRIPEFVLNREPFTHASILVAGENFGCGSSREHAAWALHEFGFRCIIAPSFAEIFRLNILKNGILPLTLPTADVEAIFEVIEADPHRTMTVDLTELTLTDGSGQTRTFAIEPAARARLLAGLDDIAWTLQHAASITRFEDHQRTSLPWLYRPPIPS
jgi:3-isopropylmalate/(R)-2-methylmalate dehydratase small subunit